MRLIAFPLVLVCSSFSALEAQVIVGQERPVEIHVPASYRAGTPMPLVLLLHGFPQDGPAVEGLFHFLELSERFSFLYAFPNGTQNPCGDRYWNAFDYCCANFCNAQPVDDSRYLRSVIEEAMQRLTVDADCIYVVGFSAGGDMAHRMACDHGDLLAGIASMSGATATSTEACPAQSPLHVLQIHGTGDTYFEGGNFQGFTLPSAAQISALWAERNGCKDQIELLSRVDYDPGLPGDETTITRYITGCRGGGSSELWAVTGGGHFVGSELLRIELVKWLLAHSKRSSPIPVLSVDPEAGTVPLTVRFDASGSQAPPDTTLDHFLWDFGDGMSGTDISTTHVFTRPGRWLASLTVTTEDGRTAMDRRTITVAGRQDDVSPWQTSDIGSPAFLGAASQDPEGAIRLVTGGSGFGGTSFGGAREDEGLFIWQTFDGHFRLQARFTEPQGGGARPQVGLMVRGNLQASSTMLSLVLEPIPDRSRARLMWRKQFGSTSTNLNRVDTSLPRLQGWLSLEREGHTFKALWSADGVAWNLIAEHSFEELAGPLLIGCVVSGADNGVTTQSYEAFQAVVREHRIIPLFPAVPFHRADPNTSGATDLSDAIAIFGYLFLGSDTPTCLESADVNNSGVIDISDGVAILNWLFGDGPEPAVPGPAPSACGVDPDAVGSEGDLGCEGYGACR